MTPATDAIEALAGLANPFAAPSSEEDRLFADAMAAADAWHRARNPRYAALWDENTRPLLPVGLFKRADLATPVDDGGETLRSSGTTSGQGTPVFFDARSMARIRQGMLHIFMRAGYFDLRPANFLVLAPDPTQGDHPGYATAFTRFTACAPQREVVYAVDADGQFSAARAWEALRRFAGEANTLFVFGLTVWFEHLALAAEAPVPLRGPLRGLTGGGWKGLARTLDRPEIVARLTAHLPGPETGIRDLFGLTEHPLHYISCAEGRFHLPAQTRAQIMGPDGQGVEDGEIGLIRLQNPLFASLPAHDLLTEDLGRRGLGCPCGSPRPWLEYAGRATPARGTCAANAVGQ